VLKKSPFFDFFSQTEDVEFNQYLAGSLEDEDYIDWNGFLLPNDYDDAEAEYRAIRDACAIFDVSPLRKYRIQGTDAGSFLDHLVTRPPSGMPAMRGVYVVFCNEDGSLKDDAILHKYADDDYMLLPSDMDHSAYFAGLLQRYGLEDISVDDCTYDWTGLAVQGPQSATVMQNMGFSGIEFLEPLAIRDFPFHGGSIRIARMGFTADLGYEIWLKAGQQQALEQAIQSARGSLDIAIPGYGLTALQACRLEGGFIVAGWDCSTQADPNPGFERSPFELGLGWLVNLDAADFVGKDALLKEKRNGSSYTLRSFTINDPRVPEDGAPLYAKVADEDVEVGIITCSSWSWDLDKMIGNASLESRYAAIKDAWTILVGDTLSVRLSRGPLRSFERSKKVPAPIA